MSTSIWALSVKEDNIDPPRPDSLPPAPTSAGDTAYRDLNILFSNIPLALVEAVHTIFLRYPPRYDRWNRNNQSKAGRKEGAAQTMLNSIKNLMETLGLTIEQAMSALKVPDADRPKYLELLANSN